MKKWYFLQIGTVIVLSLILSICELAFAQGKVNVQGGPIKEADWMVKVAGAELSEDHSGVKTWITKWYGPDGNYENNGGLVHPPQKI